jgi:hypothetical protein
VKGDLAGARDGLDRGLSAELGRDDVVYYAAWTRFLERQTKAPPNGGGSGVAVGPSEAEKTLSDAATDARWIGKIAAFGLGKLKAEQLLAAAQTPTQKTEALFYVALDKKVTGDAKGGDELLRQVIASPGIDLMEYSLARDILAGPKASLGGPVPEVAVP